jgi:hypothetical protein
MQPLLQHVSGRGLSRSCSRFANLLLVPYWKEQPRYTALAQYLADRVNLASAIESLDDDPIWQKYKNSDETADSMPIAQLLGLQVNIAAIPTNVTLCDVTLRRKTHAVHSMFAMQRAA